ncbi:MAG: hypothetical protein G3M70_08110 [Candidatus Nitronauta litoralis]|uniref:Metallo-beta-lactamase domain-containing protein n=1 Tax=Candidatus Nitronauta litoralis TaxID=2705533 RepID=A0A7T0BVZ8_9BACT|nr:MAG: hypothetical protein G3M70_08110 [Candidatus Nitronauta litoralis]
MRPPEQKGFYAYIGERGTQCTKSIIPCLLAGLLLFLSACNTPPGQQPGTGIPSTTSPTGSMSGTTVSGAPVVSDGYVEMLPALPASGYFLKKLADDVYFFSTGHYNTLFMVTTGGVILADPVRGAGPLIQKAIASVTKLPVKFLIYSSAGLDRIGDAHLFAEGSQIIAHESAQYLLRRYQDTARPVPLLAFRKNYTLNFGGKKIDLIYPGRGHGFGNTIIHLPKENVMMFAGIGGARALPGPRFETVDLYGQVLGVQRASKLEFSAWLSGRGPRTGTKDELRQLLRYYYDSRKANVSAMKSVRFQEAAGSTKSRDPLVIVDSYHQAVARDCYNRLKPVWKPRMMGFEAYALSHCAAWTDFHLTHKPPK